MSDYKRTNHTEWDCKYHIIFIPKYRKKVLYGKLRDRLGAVFRRLAHQKECEVEEGHLPSCQVALGYEGEIVAAETFGDATPDSRYCIFSATKPFVASTVWILLAEGALTLGTVVAD